MSKDSNSISVTAKSFTCSGCGSPLKIPKNSRGHVQCPSCKNDCVIEGLAKNAEIAAKENINSGVPLDASPATLHKQICTSLYKDDRIPLDVFSKIEVIREEHLCVPAYCYEYDAEAKITYEEGRQEVRQEKGYTSDGGEKITTIKEVKWHTERGDASASGTIFISGNKSIAPVVENLYSDLDHSQLVDIEHLDFPIDVNTLPYDYPEVSAFNEHAKPIIEAEVDKDGRKALNGLSYEEYIPRGGEAGVRYGRNYECKPPKITKTMTRVYLGLYRLVYKYGGEEFEMFVTGNGDDTCYDKIPLCPERSSQLANKQLAKNSIKEEKKPGCFLWGLAIILPIFLFVYGGIGLMDAIGEVAGGIIITLLTAGLIYGTVVFFKYRNRKAKEYDEAFSKASGELNAFMAERDDVVNKFKEQKKALNGIYQGLTGDSSAF